MGGRNRIRGAGGVGNARGKEKGVMSGVWQNSSGSKELVGGRDRYSREESFDYIYLEWEGVDVVVERAACVNEASETCFTSPAVDILLLLLLLLSPSPCWGDGLYIFFFKIFFSI